MPFQLSDNQCNPDYIFFKILSANTLICDQGKHFKYVFCSLSVTQNLVSSNSSYLINRYFSINSIQIINQLIIGINYVEP